MSKHTFKPLFLFLLILHFIPLSAQTELSTDELYTHARTAAFEEDNYEKAIVLLKKALVKSPNYLEVSVFLGRLYTYTDSLPKARIVFEEVLQKETGHEEASLAYANLEYWNSDSEKSLSIVNLGLDQHPNSEKLGLLKAKILKDLKRFEESRTVIDQLLKNNHEFSEARSLLGSVNSSAAKNSIGLSYDFIYFDKRFDDPWHIASIDYSRQTKLGSVIARFNYANRFTTNGAQFEIDAYPRISKLFYAYVSGGISENKGIFPRYRAGFSLYANLPASFEADAGFRFLAFSGNTWIYTVGVGKYYKSYWFNLRTYLTPSTNSISHSYSLTTRYYFGGADDYLSFKIGTGISPDDNVNTVAFDPENIYKLKSINMAIGYRKLLWDTNVFSIKASLENQEYAPETKGNQLSLSIGYSKRF
ncbi:Lipopolysaccharide assembly protein B [Arenibacter antarcticus]|uniref:YaiO family outer membrane beta-barrel protein n=1 Tax=Arenibacter antarcticus TaxID=2040469 RepID=A0ABW5VKD2_9FLAO|nr:YaiO family outer membrane beta-barrel protein [Arenibacter sp. H213]MCM4167209.1 hypothetical protein [Arenibacter sp. H213]